MPDQYGRPTFADGIGLASAINWTKENNRKDAERQTEQDAYKVADAMSNKADVSAFSPEARYKGAKLHFDNRFNEVKLATQEKLNSSAGMQETMTRLDMNLKTANERLRQYKMARQAGDDQAAKNIAIMMNNENMYTGRFIEGKPGDYTVTTQGGEKLKIKDMPIEQVDQILGSYFDKPYEDIMKWQMSAEQYRRMTNEKIISQAEPFYNESTGQVIFKVPAGAWGPDGKPRGAFFVDSQDKEIPAEQAKGFVKMSIAGAKAGIRKANAPETIDPAKMVQSGGQTGLVMQSPGGQPSFTPIKGGAEKITKPGTATEANAQYNNMVKRLETELMPFIEKGSTAIDPETFQLTTSGRAAIQVAADIVQRAQADPNALKPQEKQFLQNAQQALAMYQGLSQGNAQAFGLQMQPAAAPPQGVPQPPPGFVMD